ncbi:transcription antitermination factor NusB [Ligilactobacillus hayakitensis]|uniref:transcription antitermination factor NusB n=1 Tax=Ligilactobacillus hayakitensis TaxID=396716 RepID=UPI00046AF5D8|nr:transcription antitermination factor NusB [Ligilactobacillus hayakitensis]
MNLNRHDLRKVAFQTLFAMDSNPDANKMDVFEQLLNFSEEDLVVPNYLNTLVDGVLDNMQEIDLEISKFLKNGWTLARLNKADLYILRLSIYEIKYVESVPNVVALNEALQLAKDFTDESSRKFINGILQNLV